MREVERHLSECPDCCALVADAARLSRPDSVNPATDRPPLMAPGTRVSRYVIEEALGAGGAGVVYRANDTELRRKVALKVLRAETPDVRAGWLREAQTMARLSHPNVVNVYDLGTTDDGQVFIVIELVEGQNLSQWLRAEPRGWRAILDLFLQAGRGLATAHAGGLVHRDFKPDNVLIGADGRARVADFGLARLLDEKPPEAIAGTPGFMAPEQARGQEADARSDQFSFCVSLYAALYGHKPGSEPPADSAVPFWIHAALARGLSADPAARFASMDALLAALSQETAQARFRRMRLALLGAAGAVVLALAGWGLSHLASGDGACIADVALGYNHTCVLRRDRTVWCWGKVGFDDPLVGNDFEPESRLEPLQIRNTEGRALTRIANITSSYTTTCARELQGMAWCWGQNRYGKLGNGRVENGRRFARAERVRSSATAEMSGIVGIVPGTHHTCVIEEHGPLRCWGDNRNGQLGLGSTDREPVPLPRPIPAGQLAFLRVAAGQSHTCATRADGTVWCWGDNRNGQVGLGAGRKGDNPRPAPVQGQDGTPLSQVLDLGVGSSHSCAVTKAGELYCWGLDQFGQLGAGDHQSSPVPVRVQTAGGAPLSRITQVRAGNAFTCALDADGGVWCFGANNFGQVGHGGNAEVSARAVRVLTSEGGPPLGGVDRIALGAFSACALRRDGSLWCWGRNQGAQLGVGDTRDRNVAVQARGPCAR